MTEPTRDQELLARAIRASGLSAGEYARQVLIRDPRQVRRWLDGSRPLPASVRQHLERLEQGRLEDEDARLDAELRFWHFNE